MVRIVKYKSGNIPPEIYKVVSDILKDAFEERIKQNINFRCGSFSPKEVAEDLGIGNYLLIAYNDEGIPVGSATLKIHTKSIFKYGTFENGAIISSHKRKGIGTLLANERIKLAKEINLDFLTSCTATTADSSVSYHLKQGFIIYEKSFGEDYNSYSFIYPLKKMGFMRCKILSKAIYILLTAKNRIRKEYFL